jgi:hypothetical protein
MTAVVGPILNALISMSTGDLPTRDCPPELQQRLVDGLSECPWIDFSSPVVRSLAVLRDLPLDQAAHADRTPAVHGLSAIVSSMLTATGQTTPQALNALSLLLARYQEGTQNECLSAMYQENPPKEPRHFISVLSEEFDPIKMVLGSLVDIPLSMHDHAALIQSAAYLPIRER